MSEPIDYDLLEDLSELIDARVPDKGVPESILKTYVLQIRDQPDGLALLGSHQGPQSGHTLGTALVEQRRHRWNATGITPSPLLAWLYNLGVDLSLPDARGNTALLSALVFDVPSMTNFNLQRPFETEFIQTKSTIRSMFGEHEIDPLMVSPSGQSVLACSGQDLTPLNWGLDALHDYIEQAVLGIPSPLERWSRLAAMEAQGQVSPANAAWWKAFRAPYLKDALEAGWSDGSTLRGPRPRL